MLKKTFKYILTFIIIISIVTFSGYAYQLKSDIDLEAHTALLISLDTGEVLYAENNTEKIYPASITKLLVAIVMLENTQNIDSEIITFSKTARNQFLGSGATNIQLKVGEQLSAREALHGLLISSGGDVAYAIAEHYGGSTECFMAMVNQKAAEIGMVNSNFGNPVGLHDSLTYTTGNDIAVLAKYALAIPEISEVCAKSRYTMPATNMTGTRLLTNTNMLLDKNTNYYYKYATGVKTGFTDEAGRCVVSTASFGGYNYLCIVMGCRNADGLRHEFMDSRNLFRWAFNDFEYKSILDTSKPAAEIAVDLSMQTDHIALYPEQSLSKIFPKAADSSTVTIKPHLIAERVDAPIKAGQILGTADIIYAEEVIGTVNLVAGEDVKSNLFLQIGRGIKNIASSLPFKIILCLAVIGIIAYVIIVIKLNSGRSHRKVKYIPYDKNINGKRKK